MDAGELSLFETGIWIIPLFLIGTLGLFYGLIRVWQNKTGQDLRSIQSELRKFQTAFRQLGIETQAYSVDDREPFGSEMKTLTKKMETLGERIVLLQQQYVAVRQEVQRLSLNRRQALIGAPFYFFDWYRIRKDVGQLRREAGEIETGFTASKELVRLMGQHALEAAEQAQQAVETERRLKELLDQLAGLNVRGDAFDAAIQQEKQLRSALRRIPDAYLTESEEKVLAQADKDSVADIFEILAETQPAIEILLGQAQAWRDQHEVLTAKVADATRALNEAAGLFPNLPDELIVESDQARLKQLSTIASTLQATLTRLEIESMAEVAQEADRVRAAGQEMADQLKRARRQLVALQRISDELSAGHRQLSSQFADLAKSPVHPVVWNKSRGQLTDLSRQIAALGDSKKARLPEQVDKDLASASALLAQQKELAKQCQEVAQKHAQLVEQLESPEVKQGIEFNRSAQNLAAQVSAYAPENWPAADMVATLGRDVKDLAERHQRLVSNDPAESVYETEVAQEVEKVRALVASYQTQRARVERVKTRLAELQKVDKNTGERLQALRAVLNQVELLARSNTFLEETAGEELSSFRRRLEQQTAEQGQRQNGLVEEKARQANALASQFEQACNGWLDRLNQDIEAKKQAIAAKVDRLNQVASLDERAISEAERLLAVDVQSAVVQRAKQKPVFPLDELVTQLKPRSDMWQSCVAVIGELNDVENPLLETYQQAVQQYEAAKEQLQLAANWIPAKPAWPPTSLSLDQVIQDFNKIEEHWQMVESQHNRAIWMVRQLSDISARLKGVADKAAQLVERVEQEQTRVRDMEKELDDLSRRWQALAQEQPEAAGEIRGLRQQIERDVDDLKRQYRQGVINYSDVVQALNYIGQNVQNYRIQLADGQVIRLTGESRMYRRSY